MWHCIWKNYWIYLPLHYFAVKLIVNNACEHLERMFDATIVKQNPEHWENLQ
jgi:hypothetical protein